MMDHKATNPQISSESGGFIAGFSLGVFAGAAGYFLFGTQKGAKLRRRLINEWDNAKDHLVKEGVIDDPQISLRDFFQNLFKEVFEASLPQELMTPAKVRKTGKSAAARKPKRESAKFSGV
jgi:hypothetical protein